jgi:hypothetical protein
MKLRVVKAFEDGLDVLLKNPIIFAPALILAVVSAISNYYIYSYISESLFSFADVVRLVQLLISNVAITWLISLFVSPFIVKMVYDLKGNAAKKVKPASRTFSEMFSKTTRFIASKYLTMLISSGLCFLVIVLGYVALIIPGIYLSVRLGFYMSAIVIDDASVISSLKKSWKITKGNWWRIFGMYLLLGIVVYILSFVINFVLPASVFGIASSIASSAVIALIYTPWLLSMSTIAYMQIRR